MPDELSPSAAAARIGATTRSVQRWIAKGRLPARRVGGRWRVASDALDAFVAKSAAADARTAPGIIERLFVANRGEIAARIRRTCDALGIAAVVPVSPPVPVLVEMPAASRLNHVSIVNCAAPNPGAGPNVT